MLPIRSLRAVFLCVGAGAGCFALDDSLASLSRAVTAFKLPNGAQFFVVERPHSPILAFHLRVKAGLADEPAGQGGLAALALANFAEGSEFYGTLNAQAEKAALAEAEKLFEEARAEHVKGDQADEVKKGRSEYQARAAFGQAAAFAQQPRFFESVLSRNGAAGLEMRPSADFSDLSMILPSHRAELWFRMVGSWLQAPSTRFFLASKERLTEQRERAGQSAAMQRERALGMVFSLHPYRAMAADENELSWVAPAELRAFMKLHYVPANLTIGIVGDIGAAEARRLAEAYFGKLPATAPPEAKAVELLQADNSQPMRLAVPDAPSFVAAWPRPAAGDKSDAVFEILQAALAGGAGSPVFNALMVESKLASRLSIHSRYPGGRYPGLFVIEAEPLPNHSHEEVEVAIIKALERVASSGIDPADLERARSWWRQRLVADSLTASARSAQLVRLHTEYGTFKAEELMARLEAVTAGDCRRIVSEYLAGKPYFSVAQLTAVAGGAPE